MARVSEINNTDVQLFEEARPRLLGLAYRILAHAQMQRMLTALAPDLPVTFAYETGSDRWMRYGGWLRRSAVPRRKV
jgi:hypothetical protein